MNKSQNPILLLLCSFILCQCQTKQENDEAQALAIDLMGSSSNKPFRPVTGTWTYSFPFYSSILQMKADSTFSFLERGCMGYGYSEGSWEKQGEDYVLTSFDRYKEKKDFVLSYETIHKENKQQKRKAGKYTYELGAFEANVKVNVPDTLHVYFNNEVFRLKSDSLFWLKQNGTEGDKKFVREMH